MTMRRLASILLLSLLGGTVLAQSTDAPPAFDAADVHVSPPRRFPFRDGGLLRGDRAAINAWHRVLIDRSIGRWRLGNVCELSSLCHFSRKPALSVVP